MVCWKDTGGFTLVELTVVLTILGLLTAGGLAVSASMVTKANYIDTRKTLETLDETLRDYYMVNGRLPCPARVDRLPGSTDFGVEVSNCAAGGAITGTSRSGTPGVRIGMVPVRTLGLTDTAAQDKYGTRILYAVTEMLTDSNEFASNPGAISVRASADATTLTSEAAYVLVSHGKDRRGGRIYLNANATPFTCAGGTTQRDLENCDSDAIFRDAPFNDGDVPAQWFDDLILWTPRFHLASLNANTDSLWGSSGLDIFAMGTDSDPATGRVAIGTDTPYATLHVKGGNTLMETSDNRYLSFSNLMAGANLKNWVWEDISNSGKLALRAFNDDWSFKSNLMVINHSTGNVGIGTDSPAQRLHVSGGAMQLDALGDFYLYIHKASAPAGLRNWALQDISNAGKLAFRSRYDNWDHKQTLLAMDHSTGNVGIGTDSPSQRLHVNGNARVKDYLLFDAMTLGGGGQANVEPDIHFSESGLITANDNLYVALNADDGGTGVMYWLRNGATTSSATAFASISTNSNLFLGLDGSDSSVNGSPDTSRRLIIRSTQSYENGASIFLMGQTNSDYPGRIHYFATKASSGDEAHAFYRRWGGSSYTLFRIYANGNAALAGTLSQSSDARLKEKVSELKNPLERVLGIRGVNFHWKEDLERDKDLQLGVLAQEVQKVFPELVNTDADGYLTVNYSGLSAVLIEAVRELDNRNAALTKQVESLETRLAALEKQVNASRQQPASSPWVMYVEILILFVLGSSVVALWRKRQG